MFWTQYAAGKQWLNVMCHQRSGVVCCNKCVKCQQPPKHKHHYFKPLLHVFRKYLPVRLSVSKFETLNFLCFRKYAMSFCTKSFLKDAGVGQTCFYLVYWPRSCIVWLFWLGFQQMWRMKDWMALPWAGLWGLLLLLHILLSEVHSEYM